MVTKSHLKQLMSNAFLSMDLFGTTIQLLVKRRDVYNTFIGAFVSLFIIGFTSYSFI